jgi:hypothetical protein
MIEANVLEVNRGDQLGKARRSGGSVVNHTTAEQ